MMQETLSLTKGLNRHQLNIKELTAGSYLINILIQNGKTVTERFVKIRL